MLVVKYLKKKLLPIIIVSSAFFISFTYSYEIYLQEADLINFDNKINYQKMINESNKYTITAITWNNIQNLRILKNQVPATLNEYELFPLLTEIEKKSYLEDYLNRSLIAFHRSVNGFKEVQVLPINNMDKIQNLVDECLQYKTPTKGFTYRAKKIKTEEQKPSSGATIKPVLSPYNASTDEVGLHTIQLLTESEFYKDLIGQLPPFYEDVMVCTEKIYGIGFILKDYNKFGQMLNNSMVKQRVYNNFGFKNENLPIEKTYKELYLAIRKVGLVREIPQLQMPKILIREHAKQTGLYDYINQKNTPNIEKQTNHISLAIEFFGTEQEWLKSLNQFIDSL